MKAMASSSTISARALLKKPDHLYLQINQLYFDQFTTKPTLIKVKAHANNHWNNQVDLLAKHAATIGDPSHSPFQCPGDITTHHIAAPQSTLDRLDFKTTFRNQQPIMKYPATIIKQDFQRTKTTTTLTKSTQT